MNLPVFFLSVLCLVSIGCSKQDPEVLKTEDLIISLHASKIDSTRAYCVVSFHDADNPSVPYQLEEDSLVACNGAEAPWYSDTKDYFVSFDHLGNVPVKLTIVRPKAGATAIDYIEIQ